MMAKEIAFWQTCARTKEVNVDYAIYRTAKKEVTITTKKQQNSKKNGCMWQRSKFS